MFKRINNWHLSALIVIVSIFSLVLVQGHVQAQWNNPESLPGDTPANNLVVNPMLEDLELNDKRITGDNIIIDPDSLDTISIDNDTNTARLCLNEDCRAIWPTVTAGGGLWDGVNPGDIYYNAGNVGIGTDTPETSLEIYGTNADESNLRLQNPSGDMKLIFKEYDDAFPYGDASVRYYSGSGDYDNWLEFWGKFSSQGPIMTMQRDYNPTEGNYLGVGIGVPSGTNINAKLRVQGDGSADSEDILQLYDNNGEVFSVHESGSVNIGGGNDHTSVKLNINDGGVAALKLDFDDVYDLGEVFAFASDLSLRADYDILLKANKVGIGAAATAPGYPLHIADDDATAILNIDDGGTPQTTGYLWTGTRLERDNVEKWFIGMDDTDKGLKFRANDYIDSMVLDSDNSTTTLNLNGDDGAFLNIVATDAYNDNVANVGISFSRNDWKTDLYTDYSMSVTYGNFSINSYYTDTYNNNPALPGYKPPYVGIPLYIKDIGAGQGENPQAGYVGINNTNPLAQMHVYNDRDGGIAIYGQAASSADGTYAGYFTGDVEVDGDLGVVSVKDSVNNYIQLDVSSSYPPPLTDCDETSEIGRMIWMQDDYNKLFVCSTEGWRYVALTGGPFF